MLLWFYELPGTKYIDYTVIQYIIDSYRAARSACVLLLSTYFLRTSSVGGGGGGGMLPDFFFCSLFPVQQTTSGIGHRVK